MTEVATLLLAVETGDGRVERLRIDHDGPVVIGRDPSCHVVLPSPDVSRRHVMLELDPRGVRLTDQSANGTFVGDTAERIVRSSVIVAPHVPFRIGPYVVRILPPPAASGDAVGRTVPPPPSDVAARHQLVAGPLALAFDGPTIREDEGAATPPPAPRPRKATPAAAAPALVAPPAAAIPGVLPAGAARSDKYVDSGTGVVPVEIRRRIHRQLLENLDLARLDRNKMDDRIMRPKVREALTRICRAIKDELPAGSNLSALIDELTDEALGLGPLEALIADETVSEIMVVDPQTIFIERGGRIEHTELRFTDDDAVRACIERIITPLGRRIDESNPLVDARLKDGSRVNAIIPPLALRGPCITIRKFKKDPLRIPDLIGFGAFTDQIAKFLTRAVITRKNIVISGGTGSGKTTLLNVLSSAIPERERIVTIEDAAELRLTQPHVVSLEAKPSNMEGRGEITIRDLVRNALRMRPDRIIVGECRGGEALDMLQAMNTGHEGSMTTTHANSPREALARLETLALMSGLDLPARAIREQIAASIHLILQQTRFSDGSRRVTAVSEIVGIDENGDIETHDIFQFVRTGTGQNGDVLGEFRATGYLPSFIDEFISHGLVRRGDYL